MHGEQFGHREFFRVPRNTKSNKSSKLEKPENVGYKTKCLLVGCMETGQSMPCMWHM